MIDSLYKLVATLFPGGYRFFVVNLVAIFCSKNISDGFSQLFFIISLLTTFTGVAVSTQSYVLERALFISSRLLLMFGLLVIISGPFYLFWEGDVQTYVLILISVSVYSAFEIFRSDFSANGNFKQLTICSFFSVALAFLAVYKYNDDLSYIVVLVFLSLLIPLSFARSCYGGNSKLNIYVVKDVISYSLSNGITTGLSFLLPLLLIEEFGMGEATKIAQVFTLSALFMFYPRYLSAGFLVESKKNICRKAITSFESKVFFYVLVLSCFFYFLSILFFVEFLSYAFLFISIVSTQLALPYSNSMMILGKGGDMLKLNFSAFSAFFVLVFCLYLFLDSGSQRGELILYIYTVFVLVRAFLIKRYVGRLVLR